MHIQQELPLPSLARSLARSPSFYFHCTCTLPVAGFNRGSFLTHERNECKCDPTHCRSEERACSSACSPDATGRTMDAQCSAVDTPRVTCLDG